MKAMLHKHGLEPNRDYTVVEAPFPAMKSMLAEKKVDLIPAVLPFSYDPELQQNRAAICSCRSDAIGVTDMVVWTARKPFIDKHRAALVDFFEDTLRITHWYADPKNHEEACRSSAPDQAAAAVFDWVVHQTGLLSRSRSDAEPRRAAEERRHDQGSRFHRAELRRQKIFRLSMVEEAAKRLQSE